VSQLHISMLHCAIDLGLSCAYVASQHKCRGDFTMATIARSQTRTAAHPVADSLHGLALRFRAFREAAHKRSRIRRELMTYTDHQLADLGLSRGDIPSVAAGTYRR
jgi:uncharacterized protein YjiS (DUF1127 family)